MSMSHPLPHSLSASANPLSCREKPTLGEAVMFNQHLTGPQRKILSDYFSQNPRPEKSCRKELSESFGVQLAQISKWFENRLVLAMLQAV
jgi:hypothetical protein